MMARRILEPGALLLTAAAALVILLPAPQAAAAPKVHTIIVDKMKFGPVPAQVRAGDTIRWINRDIFKHSATARDRSFNIDLPPKSSGRMVIRRDGSIPFFCIYHPGMKGALRVTK